MSQSIISVNRARQALEAGQVVKGTMLVEIRQPAVMQLLANAGFDFVIIDNEHGPFNIETIADLSRMAQLVGLTPIVRVPDLAYPYIAQSLDGGAQGVMIPRVTTPEQARLAVEMTRYPPLGQRGSALSRGYTRFRSGSVPEVMAQVNRETLLLVQIETRGALDNIEAIAATPGIDALFIGPNDLSIALGVPGQIDSPPVRQGIEKTIAVCRQYNLIPALHMNDANLAADWVRRGMRLISVGSEAGMLVKGGQAVISTLSTTIQEA